MYNSLLFSKLEDSLIPLHKKKNLLKNGTYMNFVLLFEVIKSFISGIHFIFVMKLL